MSNYLDLQVRVSGSNCADGSKFAISWVKGNRKHIFLLDAKDILAFAKNGEKFAICTSEVVSQVRCKVTR